MNSKILTGVIVAVIAVIGVGAAMMASNEDENSSMSNMSQDDMENMNKQSESSDKGMVETVSTNQIVYKDFDVDKKVIRVKKGTTVTWTNEDTAKHDVTPENETAEFKASKLFGKGETYQVTFNTVGTYNYICSPHPYMKGAIEVTE